MSSDSWAPTCPVTEGLRCLRGQGWAQLGALGPGGGGGGRGSGAVVGISDHHPLPSSLSAARAENCENLQTGLRGERQKNVFR